MLMERQRRLKEIQQKCLRGTGVACGIAGTGLLPADSHDLSFPLIGANTQAHALLRLTEKRMQGATLLPLSMFVSIPDQHNTKIQSACEIWSSVKMANGLEPSKSGRVEACRISTQVATIGVTVHIRRVSSCE